MLVVDKFEQDWSGEALYTVGKFSLHGDTQQHNTRDLNPVTGMQPLPEQPTQSKNHNMLGIIHGIFIKNDKKLYMTHLYNLFATNIT